MQVKDIINTDSLADQIVALYLTWNNERVKWLEEQKEKRAYLHATSTKTTSVGDATPWKNNTTLPKLTQIRDNLHANYMATLFPNSNWLGIQGKDSSEETKSKKQATIAYMQHKAEISGFRSIMSQLVLDWIDFGNCFATTDYVDETITLDDGEIIAGYVGPKLVRISPYDIVFNPSATSFEKTPKIIRSIKTLAELKREIEDHPEKGYLEDVFERAVSARVSLTDYIASGKQKALQDDGFGGLDKYYESEYVEILDFYGDIYDKETGELFRNHTISVVDRSFIIRNKKNPNWLGKDYIHHAGWRDRSDNLYAQGPLDNLVGMQFMIDKLQNTKADITDQNIHPMWKVRGQVEDFEPGPNVQIIVGDDGDVVPLRPDMTYLSVSNNEIVLLMNQMEEMAGAPRQAMGIRTPGEKTKFEVQTLENATNRIFIHATSHFEEVFVEKILNNMLELSRRNMSLSEEIRMESDEFGSVLFKSISKEDLSTKGTLKARGARRFAELANRLQELTQIGNALTTNPATKNHISGLTLTKQIAELAGFDKVNNLVQENIALAEQIQSEQFIQKAQQITAEQTVSGAVDPSIADIAEELPEV